VKRFVLFHYSPKYRGMQERLEEEAMREFKGDEGVGGRDE
jgi:ribonuclease BN (tRNA processing enzyme)